MNSILLFFLMAGSTMYTQNVNATSNYSHAVMSYNMTVTTFFLGLLLGENAFSVANQRRKKQPVIGKNPYSFRRYFVSSGPQTAIQQVTSICTPPLMACLAGYLGCLDADYINPLYLAFNFSVMCVAAVIPLFRQFL